MGKITVELDPGEAILALGAISDRSAAAFAAWRRLMVTGAPYDEQEAAKVSAQVLARVEARLQNALYPECDWMDNETCPLPVVGKATNGLNYCAFHTARLQAQIEQLAL